MAHKALITNVGRNKEAAALAQQEALEITHIAWGDGDRVPGGGETALMNEQGRKSVQGNGVVSGALNTAFFEILLDTTEGPFTIREAGLFDKGGDLIAIARYDPPVNQVKGATSSLIRIHVLFSDLQNLVLQVQGTDAYVPVERKIHAGTGLTGGGDLSADRTLAVAFATEAEAMAGTVMGKSVSPATLKKRLEPIEDRLNSPIIQTSAGTGSTSLVNKVWKPVTNGNLTVTEAGKYQVTATFRMYANNGHEPYIDWWIAAIALNGTRIREIFGLNADQTGVSNQDATSTSLIFTDLAVGDVLSHQFFAETTQQIDVFYAVTYDILKIGETS